MQKGPDQTESSVLQIDVQEPINYPLQNRTPV